ncbi:cortical anchoring factor for dynein Mcp5/Num1 [Schizosaccharomyces japonicus yFS275]|uniref:Cortical anchoring factor for dynein Mcp5/Num1 n=1 Tax=Schizosaccharomyces japonicus (strain yFS275 / FY16936) TaxID=402676 RepID=B6JVF8_SCHJY|nr:cortical anchoring factor for dynein Mcp5/Num1 [Schizosaccharomyces japonicus yFS275]EEB05359.1 cortical anchoring factor for dynein Mcp5/Num1 [Schizosaccharomyces japonicus yFS275]
MKGGIEASLLAFPSFETKDDVQRLLVDIQHRLLLAAKLGESLLKQKQVLELALSKFYSDGKRQLTNADAVFKSKLDRLNDEMAETNRETQKLLQKGDTGQLHSPMIQTSTTLPRLTDSPHIPASQYVIEVARNLLKQVQHVQRLLLQRTDQCSLYRKNASSLADKLENTKLQSKYSQQDKLRVEEENRELRARVQQLLESESTISSVNKRLGNENKRLESLVKKLQESEGTFEQAHEQTCQSYEDQVSQLRNEIHVLKQKSTDLQNLLDEANCLLLEVRQARGTKSASQPSDEIVSLQHNDVVTSEIENVIHPICIEDELRSVLSSSSPKRESSLPLSRSSSITRKKRVSRSSMQRQLFSLQTELCNKNAPPTIRKRQLGSSNGKGFMVKPKARFLLDGSIQHPNAWFDIDGSAHAESSSAETSFSLSSAGSLFHETQSQSTEISLADWDIPSIPDNNHVCSGDRDLSFKKDSFHVEDPPNLSPPSKPSLLTTSDVLNLTYVEPYTEEPQLPVNNISQTVELVLLSSSTISAPARLSICTVKKPLPEKHFSSETKNQSIIQPLKYQKVSTSSSEQNLLGDGSCTNYSLASQENLSLVTKDLMQANILKECLDHFVTFQHTFDGRVGQVYNLPDCHLDDNFDFEPSARVRLSSDADFCELPSCIKQVASDSTINLDASFSPLSSHFEEPCPIKEVAEESSDASENFVDVSSEFEQAVAAVSGRRVDSESTKNEPKSKSVTFMINSGSSNKALLSRSPSATATQKIEAPMPKREEQLDNVAARCIQLSPMGVPLQKNQHSDSVPHPSSSMNITEECIAWVTQGSYMHKRIRGFSRFLTHDGRHKRYAWIHPSLLTLNWTRLCPNFNAPKNMKTRTMHISSFHIVEEKSKHAKAGSHNASIIICSGSTSVCLVAETSEIHNIWVCALERIIHSKTLSWSEQQISQMRNVMTALRKRAGRRIRSYNDIRPLNQTFRQ